MRLLGLALMLWSAAVILAVGWQCVMDQLDRWLERRHDDPLTPGLWAAGTIRQVPK